MLQILSFNKRAVLVIEHFMHVILYSNIEASFLCLLIGVQAQVFGRTLGKFRLIHEGFKHTHNVKSVLHQHEVDVLGLLLANVAEPFDNFEQEGIPDHFFTNPRVDDREHVTHPHT